MARNAFIILVMISFFAFSSVHAEAQTETESAFPCEILAPYVLQPGVAYQPGIDVTGKAVVPADLNAVQTPVPQVIKIPVTIDLVDRLASSPDLPEGLLLEAPVALVEIHDTGQVTYNGQDISGDVYGLCAIDKTAKTDSGHDGSPEIITGPETEQAK